MQTLFGPVRAVGVRAFLLHPKTTLAAHHCHRSLELLVAILSAVESQFWVLKVAVVFWLLLGVFLSAAREGGEA
jgi:hypothetical protein